MSGFGGEEFRAEVAGFVGAAALAGLPDFELGVRGEEAGVVGRAFGEFFAARWVEGWSEVVLALGLCGSRGGGGPVGCGHFRGGGWR